MIQYIEEMSVELLFIGNELLIGKILNTNGQWLTRQITLLGGTCTRITIVRDDLEEIEGVIKEILNRSPKYLIISGGLGPTYDDMTLESVSKALNRPLEINAQAFTWVSQRYEEFYKKGLIKEREMSPQRTKMARLPLFSRALENPVGTAPGIHIEVGFTNIYCLPGVPKELEAIFEKSVRGNIEKEIRGFHFEESSFIVEDIGESTIAPIIRDAMERFAPYVYIKSHPRSGLPKVKVEFHLTSKGPEKEQLKQKVREAVRYLKKNIKELGGEIVPL